MQTHAQIEISAGEQEVLDRILAETVEAGTGRIGDSAVIEVIDVAEAVLTHHREDWREQETNLLAEVMLDTILLGGIRLFPVRESHQVVAGDRGETRSPLVGQRDAAGRVEKVAVLAVSRSNPADIIDIVDAVSTEIG